jgi:hypothetical protein
VNFLNSEWIIMIMIIEKWLWLLKQHTTEVIVVVKLAWLEESGFGWRMIISGESCGDE